MALPPEPTSEPDPDLPDPDLVELEALEADLAELESTLAATDAPDRPGDDEPTG